MPIYCRAATSLFTIGRGVCCSSGWPIPVERDRVIPIQSLTTRADTSWLIADADAPADVAGTLALGANGHCVFHGSGCAVHAARPVSCAHFPFICLIDARGVHVTLSHYCPTAASMLFDDTGSPTWRMRRCGSRPSVSVGRPAVLSMPGCSSRP